MRASIQNDNLQAEALSSRLIVPAFKRPFGNRTSLIVGGLIFAGILSAAQFAYMLGGLFTIAAVLLCILLVSTAAFSVIMNAVAKGSHGDLDRGFMPAFSGPTIWNNRVRPFFLGIGACLAAFGPFIVAMTVGLYLAFSSLEAERLKFESEIQSLPGTHYYAGRETAQQSQEVRQVLADRSVGTDGAAGGPVPVTKLGSEAELSVRFDPAAAAEASQREMNDVAARFLRIAPPVVVVCGLLLAWGIFYFPATIAVAARTRSFAATIDPAMCLDTVRRFGADYIRVVLVLILLLIIASVCSYLIAAVLAPFDLPSVGNIPARFISSFLAFYLVAVFTGVFSVAIYTNRTVDRQTGR